MDSFRWQQHCTGRQSYGGRRRRRRTGRTKKKAIKELQLRKDKKRQPRITTCPASFADSNNQVCVEPKLHHNGSFDCHLCGKQTQFLSKEGQHNHMKYQVCAKPKVAKNYLQSKYGRIIQNTK